MFKKKLAILSSGFLRNYKFFVRNAFYKQILENFDVDIYIGTWQEDGYGSNSTQNYTENLISKKEVEKEFGKNLKFLKMNSFSRTKETFKYYPVKNLLNHEPHVLEKYRSKFFCLKEIEIEDKYDVYLHIRFDLLMDDFISKKILDKISDFSGEGFYVGNDLYGRQGCMGDIFQISSYRHIKQMQNFYDALFSDKFLENKIPRIPEIAFHKYFSDLGVRYDVVNCPIYIIRNKYPDDGKIDNMWEWWHKIGNGSFIFQNIMNFPKSEIFGQEIDYHHPDESYWSLEENQMIIYNDKRLIFSKMKKLSDNIYSGPCEFDKNVEFMIKKVDNY